MTGDVASERLHAVGLLLASTARLEVTLASLDDAVVAGPSSLPGWNRAMVLTHIARNADAFRRVVEGAAAGESVAMYPDGPAGRNADIEAGQERSASALADDVRASADALEAALGSLGPEGWAGTGTAAFGALRVSDIPAGRRREVEVHHVDLGLAYRASNWPADFVAAELDAAAADLPRRLPAGTAVRLVSEDGEWTATSPPGAAHPTGGEPEEVVVEAPRAELLAWLLGRPCAVLGAPDIGNWR